MHTNKSYNCHFKFTLIHFVRFGLLSCDCNPAHWTNSQKDLPLIFIFLYMYMYGINAPSNNEYHSIKALHWTFFGDIGAQKTKKKQQINHSADFIIYVLKRIYVKFLNGHGYIYMYIWLDDARIHRILRFDFSFTRHMSWLIFKSITRNTMWFSLQHTCSIPTK